MKRVLLSLLMVCGGRAALLGLVVCSGCLAGCAAGEMTSEKWAQFKEATEIARDIAKEQNVAWTAEAEFSDPHVYAKQSFGIGGPVIRVKIQGNAGNTDVK